MNYITEIKGFNDLLLRERLSSGQIALWYALMHIDNKSGWKKWFKMCIRDSFRRPHSHTRPFHHI